MKYEIINDQFNAVQVVKREDGKFGIQEVIEGEIQEPEFSYRTQEMAEKTAKAISAENDRIDAYENNHR